MNSQPFRLKFRPAREPRLEVRKYQLLPPSRLYEVQRELHRRIARRVPGVLETPASPADAIRP